jgi:hypothetical protein
VRAARILAKGSWRLTDNVLARPGDLTLRITIDGISDGLILGSWFTSGVQPDDHPTFLDPMWHSKGQVANLFGKII